MSTAPPSRRVVTRHHNANSRTRALFDTLGVVKRGDRLDGVNISRGAQHGLAALAEHLGVAPVSLAAFLIEHGIRERNPIACACGCGELLDQHDRNGRPRKFMRGHFANVQWRQHRGRA